MPVQNVIQTNWTAGEFSPKLLSRVDLAKYANGAETIENFTIMPWGGARKRGGSRFVATTKDNMAARLQDFVFSIDQAYTLEFGINYIRFHSEDATVTETGATITGATQANPIVITATNTFNNGDRVIVTGVTGMTEINNREFTVASASGSSFALSGIDGTGYTAYSSAGEAAKIVEVSTVYSASDLDALRFTQSADTLYIVHPSYSPKILTRNSATSWTLADAEIVNGPFRDTNTDDTITLYLSGGSATGYGTYAEGDTGVTLTASSALFTASHVNSLWRLYGNQTGGGWTQLVGNSTPITLNLLYENAGNVYAVTDDSLSSTNWQLGMTLPTHTKGAVKAYKDGDVANYAELTYVHDGSVIVRVTGISSDTVVTVTIEKNDAPAEVIGSGNATSFWEEGAFSTERGWPGTITFYEERLWLANSESERQTVWASKTGAFLDFEDGDEDDEAITFTISSEQVDAIQWLSGGRVLSIGTTDGEYIATAETSTKPLTPADVTIRRQTRYGTANNIAPARIGDVVLFAQRYGDSSNGSRVVREHSYQFENDSYLGRNITILSDHITGAGVTKFAYQASPFSVLWALRSDGTLAALTYERDQDVLAWHRHLLGGVSSTVESIAAIPGDVGDDLWMIVARTVDGGTERHIERMTIGLDDDGAIEDAQFVDAHLAYDGASTSTISGLWHLRGETVRVFADGVDTGTATVSATGVVTLGSAASKIVIGYGITAKILSLRAEAAVASGTAQGKRKRISEATLRLYQSYSGSFGGDATRTDDLDYDSVALYTGDKRVEWPDGWNYDGRYYLEHSEAYPFIPTGIVTEVRGTG